MGERERMDTADLRPGYAPSIVILRDFPIAHRCPTFDMLFTLIIAKNDGKTFRCNFRGSSTLALGLRYIDPHAPT